MLQIPEAAQWLPLNTPAALAAKGPLMLPEVARQLGLTETQVVQAVTKVRGERMELFLNGRSIEAPPGWRVSPGQTVWLTAHSTAQGLWVLRLHASRDIAERAMRAAGAKVGATATQSANTTANAAATQTAKATSPPPSSTAVDQVQAAAARVERAKVVLQARADGQDPVRVLAQRTTQNGQNATSSNAVNQATVTPAFKPLGAADLKLMSAQDALNLQREGRVLGTETTRPAGLPQGQQALQSREGLAKPNVGLNNSLAPYLTEVSQATSLRPPGVTSTAGTLKFHPWSPGVVRDGFSDLQDAAKIVPQGLQGTSKGALQGAGNVNAKRADVWMQSAAPQFIDWSQASPRVRELSVHPLGMQAALQLFQPQVLAALLQNPALAQWAALIYQNRTSMRRPNEASIKALVEHTLQPAEAQLAKGQAAQTSQDMRSMLADLLRVLKAQGDAHSTLVQAALSDVESAQLDHLRALHQREWSLQCVLPFGDAPAVHLELQRERETPDQDGRIGTRWWVNLFTESEDLGQVWMRSGVSRQDEVEMEIWASREHVVSDARARADDMAELLVEAGLSLTSFKVTHGKKPAGPGRVSLPHGAVLDQQA